MEKSKQTLVVLVFKAMEGLKQLVMIFITISTFDSTTYIHKLIAKKEKKKKEKIVHSLRNKNRLGSSTPVH